MVIWPRIPADQAPNQLTANALDLRAHIVDLSVESLDPALDRTKSPGSVRS
jgi:hypothetical protein